MKRLFCSSISILILWSCSNTTQTERAQQDLTTFPNIAVVTEDSCARWSKPLTAFTVEYPSHYRPEYNIKANYLDLRHRDSAGNVIQHISLGKNQHIIGKEQIEKWTHLMDSMMHVSPAYDRDTIEYANYGNNKFYILRATLNYDFLTQPGFKGKYKMTSFIVPPLGTERTNGVLWSVITREDSDTEELRKEARDVLNTLHFNE